MCIGDLEIPCAVLDPGHKRVLTQSGFMIALGRARQAKGRQYYDGDVNLPAFLTAKNLKPFIHKDLEVTSSQIEFLTLCKKAAEEGTFAFFREAQKQYLKSMIAYPILHFREPDGTISQAAVVIDTNVAGHFKEEDRGVIEFFMDEFAARLNLEALLVGLLTGGEP